jgi:hypothetical protein
MLSGGTMTVTSNVTIPDYNQGRFQFDSPRRENQRTAILEALKKAGSKGCTNIELGEICQRFGGRIFELRKEGFRIEREYIEESVFRYTLYETQSQD